MLKIFLKEKAIEYRKQGFSYSEILELIPVARSTLSLWLREVGLSEKQNQRITQKKKESALRGGQARKNQRLKLTQEIHEQSKGEIGTITKRELWLIGVVLYWAEGSKEKAYYAGTGIAFTNSDPKMIKTFLRWLLEICHIEKERIVFEIYIHEIYKPRFNEIIYYWSLNTNFLQDKFKKIYYKKHTIKTTRKNSGDLYYGCLRVNVSASSEIVRKIDGWVQGIVK